MADIAGATSSHPTVGSPTTDRTAETERFAALPLDRIGLSPFLSRVLKGNGVKSLDELIEHESEIRASLTPALNGELTTVIDKHRGENGATRRLEPEKPDTPIDNDAPRPQFKPMSVGAPSDDAGAVIRAHQDRAKTIRNAGPTAQMPCTEYGNYLLEFEKRFSKVLEQHLMAEKNTYIFTCLMDLTDETDKLMGAFYDLFSDNTQRQRILPGLIGAHVPTAFLAFFSRRAHETYGSNNLWRNFFEFDGCELNENTKQDLINLYMDLMRRQGLRTYEREDELHGFRYRFSTALLHGGLSQELWENLWRSCLIPLARWSLRQDPQSPSIISGSVLFDLIVNRENEWTPKEATLTVLEGLPRRYSSELLGDAYRTALHAIMHRASMGSAGTTIFVPEGILSPIALMTLTTALDEDAEGAAHAEGMTKVDAIWAPLSIPRLRFDEQSGEVVVHLPQLHVDGTPEAVSNLRDESYVNGQTTSRTVTTRQNRLFIPEKVIRVSPAREFNVSTSLFLGDKRVGGKSESLRPQHGGIWEFHKTPSGHWEYQTESTKGFSSDEILLLHEGDDAIADIEEDAIRAQFEAEDRWAGWCCTIVDGRLYSRAMGRSPVTTSENRSAIDDLMTVEVTGGVCVGRTEESLDVYGVRKNENDPWHNAALPELTLTCIGDETIFDGLQAELCMEGHRPFKLRLIKTEDYDDEGVPKQVSIRTADYHDPPVITDHCSLRITRGEGGPVLVEYPFAIAPVDGLELCEMKRGKNGLFSKYHIHLAQQCQLDLEDFNYRFSNAIPELSFRVRSDKKVQTVAFSMGGRRLKTDIDLAPISIEKPPCMEQSIPSVVDAVMPTSASEGMGFIEVHAPRKGLSMRLVGRDEILSIEPDSCAKYPFDVLTQAILRPDSTEGEVERPLLLFVSFGFSPGKERLKASEVTVEIGRYIEGLGPRNVFLIKGRGRNSALVLERPLKTDVWATVTSSSRTERDVTNASMCLQRGKSQIPVSSVRTLFGNGGILTLAPMGPFDTDSGNDDWARIIEIPGKARP